MLRVLQLWLRAMSANPGGSSQNSVSLVLQGRFGGLRRARAKQPYVQGRDAYDIALAPILVASNLARSANLAR